MYIHMIYIYDIRLDIRIYLSYILVYLHKIHVAQVMLQTKKQENDLHVMSVVACWVSESHLFF